MSACCLERVIGLCQMLVALIVGYGRRGKQEGSSTQDEKESTPRSSDALSETFTLTFQKQ
jgi:predicted DNA-binding WGR domain protein